MWRRLILGFALVYSVVLVVLAVLLRLASPGLSSQAILGVGIGSRDSEKGIAYLSGRRLHCTPIEGSETLASQCTVDLAGKPLTIRAQRNPPSDPNQLGGTCEADYNGKSWPCRIGSRHIHVHWFAYLEEPLGLSEEQLDALRRRYFFENRSEETLVVGIKVVTPLTALVTGASVVAGLWPRVENKLLVTLAGVLTTVTTFPVAFILTMLAARGLFD